MVPEESNVIIHCSTASLPLSLHRFPCSNTIQHISPNSFDTASDVCYLRYQKHSCVSKGSASAQLQMTSPHPYQRPQTSLSQEARDSWTSVNITILQDFCFLWRNSPMRARATSFLKFLDHAQQHITLSRTPLNEWSAHCRQHNTHKILTSCTLLVLHPYCTAFCLVLFTYNTQYKHPCPRKDSNL